MKPLNLKEFAEDMRRKGDIRDADMADEILMLIDLEKEVAEPYSELCADLENYAPAGLKDKPEKALEWIGDRSNLLEEIEKQLEEAGRKGDADDVVKALLGIMAEAEAILEAAGWPGDGDFIDGLKALAERPAPMEFDL